MVHPVSQSGHITYGIKKWVLDEVEDFQDMDVSPGRPGSEAYCIENGVTYILNKDGDWKIKKGISNEDIYDFFTAEEVLAILQGGTT